MQFRDLHAQYDANKETIDKAISDVISSTHFIGGEQVGELESRLADYVGVKHCISCANGTDALQLALMAWNIGEGDAVFVPDFTFFSSAEAVPCVGATPVFVDVRKDTFNIDVSSLEGAIEAVIKEGRLIPKAVVAVDLFGQPAEHEAIRKVADKYNLFVLEDGAQGFGGRIGDKLVCSFGDISTTSFFPAKPLGCYGDGGAIFTDNDDWADVLRSLKVHGKGSNKYDNIRIGMNSRLDTLQAAILLAKLDSFINFEIDAVNKVAEEYSCHLADKVETPTVLDGYVSSWAQYTIKLSDKEHRDELQNRLKAAGIPSMVYYPKALHKQEAFANCKIYGDGFVNTEILCDTVLSLPMHPYMEMEDLKKVIDTILE